jgi:hypothetical protein
MQETATFLIVLAAVLWLAARWRRRRAGGNCCGEAKCPAARSALERMLKGKR